MDTNLKDYLIKQQEAFEEYEAKCKQCGACCGALDKDPCVHLIKEETGKFLCGVYEKRLGNQISLSGKSFNCIPIREILKKGIFYSGCAYNLKI